MKSVPVTPSRRLTLVAKPNADNLNNIHATGDVAKKAIQIYMVGGISAISGHNEALQPWLREIMTTIAFVTAFS